MQRSTIIVAGGSGKRLGGPVPKQFQPVNGRPILMWTIEAFHEYDEAMPIIVVLPEEHFDIWKALCMGHRFFIHHQVVAGGEQRYHSVKAGLDKVEGDGLVAVHDGVRPVITKDLIWRCFDGAHVHGAAIPVVPVVPSIRETTAEGSRALDRSRLLAVQTPQCFHVDLLRQAFELPYDPAFTDEASMVERMGVKVHLVEGEENNIKVTTALDLQIAAALL
ncbi:MAG: 2-C-methyl-D-erythritol 4-phosphate cytidylyltransferase [Flavobacteriales bacterium]|nr:2-C-methyl-D-erythritol 4-phosphate cytidylyltransferase [Flavobacteriales bacterium]MBP6641623.1 2-C-methyl-D-erythritol 4-phosphate cytidylyltransferase [Flavobacteriales bacterium]MBP7155183.1 2-C-methyl-D-erythritol 4-phosphate cytidylyltransferase [Flavobacteriales bacterium]HQV75820.1 2-C-methyl-D-erythritol 4-phosphate cytidylyltransferase [Flavobacteriales bacterium]HQW41516.1 2-C-methyl-D-erythritol 4-phosphate cytidylyltransferase [Flavobacteriales bacterium]